MYLEGRNQREKGSKKKKRVVKRWVSEVQEKAPKQHLSNCLIAPNT